MKLHPQDLEKLALLTLEHYNQRAEEFWEGTRDHNPSQNIEALLQHIEAEPPFRILDFGCGPGRDLKVFVEQGHVAVGLEGAPHFAATGEKQDHHRDCHENRLDDQRPIVMRRNRRIRPAPLIATRRRFLPMSATCLRRRV
jgi:cyclopropane fatty-acyl-phospholipid synthase-like methyltransferase